MKAKFVFDTDVLSKEELNRLTSALEGEAEADVPLLLELLLVDEETIRRLNADERGIDKVTDVLSFPSMDDIKGVPIYEDGHADELDEEGNLFLGSIVICEKRAREQAEEYGHSYERELNYLTVHGVMHCLGYDHMTDEEKAEMRQKEEAVMNRMKITRE